jgi:hypothetical protein
MSKILATLIAGVFAVSAFAADVPQYNLPHNRVVAEANAPATIEAKGAPKHHKHAKAKRAAKAEAATPAAKEAPAKQK